MSIVNGVYKPTYNWEAPSCMEHGHLVRSFSRTETAIDHGPDWLSDSTAVPDDQHRIDTRGPWMNMFNIRPKGGDNFKYSVYIIPNQRS